jgi:hypothetical protein
MASPKPENTNVEPVIEDSGVHVTDTERAPVGIWQLLVTALLVVTILVVFFYGLTEQRTYVAGLNPPKPNIASQTGNAHETATANKATTPPQVGQPTAPATPEGGATTGSAR